MRLTVAMLYCIIILALLVCTHLAQRSKKPIGKAVAALDLSLIPPVIGNLLIVGSTTYLPALVGCYIYFLGTNLVVAALVRFTDQYCRGIGDGQQKPTIMYTILILDVVQMILNIFFKHAFVLEPILVGGAEYFRLVPRFGQIIHRIVNYGSFFCVILIFFLATVKTTRVYRERFSVILTTMISIGIWQSFYVFSRSPVDTSMIGYGIYGCLVFYFSLYYRPMRLLDRMLSSIVSELSEAIYVFDPRGTCIWANSKGCELAGIASGSYEEANTRLIAMFGNAGKTGDTGIAERMVGNGDTARYYTLEESEVRDENNKRYGTYLRINDITEQKLRLRRELYEATHDRLTGLYTREFLYTQIEEVMESQCNTAYYAVFVDVKNFKVVNDVFGVEFGDYAIQCIADWVRRDMSERTRYGRLAGDTFGVFVPQEEFDPVQLEAELSGFTIRTERAEYHLLIHLGVYAIDPSDRDVSVMFDRAHLSLSTIQDEYHTHIAFYDDTIREQLLWQQEISAQLYDAVREMQLRPYLQPIADANGKIVGAEALARWIHPKHGFLAPYKFIPVFEKNGMIVEVDKHIWRCACAALARWKDTYPDLFVSVNISPKDFYFMDVVAEIKRLVQEYGISPRCLRIEITETVMMNDADNRMSILEEFRRSGFIVEMDDFGSGYSSLNMLKDMPVDVLKIDMKFLSKTGDAEKARTIVRNILNLSRELGIASLTEGVETQQQYETLSAMGCILFQGYYFAKPLPVEEFEQMMRERNA